MINNEDFLYIEDCKNDINYILKDINNKCENLDTIYKEYIKDAVLKEEFISSLDKMLFHIEITRKDVQNTTELYKFFMYKMYGQYYKFYIKIIDILQNLDSFDFLKEIQVKNFRPFTDIEYSFYSFEEIQIINNSIIDIINNLDQIISKNIYMVEDDAVRVKKGVNINQLVYEKYYTIETLKQKKELFQKILFDYYSFQKKFSERIKLKLKLIFYYIEKDVEFEFVSYSSKEVKIKDTNSYIEEIVPKEIIKGKESNILDIFYSLITSKIEKILNLVCIYK